MSTIKSFLSSAFVQFSFGCIGWGIFPFVFIGLLINLLHTSEYMVTYKIPLVMFLIGIGLAIFTIRKRSLRWLGIGISVALFLYVLGAFALGGCIEPFVLPFPLSLMSGC